MAFIFIRRIIVIACMVLMLPLISRSFKQSSPTLPLAQIASVYVPGIEDEILYYVNNYRSSKGLPPLKMNDDMSAEAEKHSVDMATNKVAFGHDGFEGRVKIISKKIGGLHASAENVAYGNLTPKEVVDIWLKSPGHRRNIEGRYSLTGIGIATGENNTLFFTQIFADR